MGIYEEERVWERHWDNSTDRLLEEYKKSFRLILNHLFGVMTENDFNQLSQKKQAEIFLYIATIIGELEEANQNWIDKELETAFKVGQASVMVQLGLAKSIKEALPHVTNNRFSRATLNTIMKDTMEDLLFATNNTEKRTKRLVRETFSTALRQQMMLNQGLNTTEKKIRKELAQKFIEESLKKDGFIGIVDSAGRKWRLDTYVKMATRTKMINTFRDGVLTETKEQGVDLMFISDHGAKDNCKKFEGLVVSLTGETEGYPLLDDIRSRFSNDIFHPNCKHKLRPLRNIDLLPPTIAKRNKENRKHIQNIL